MSNETCFIWSSNVAKHILLLSVENSITRSYSVAELMVSIMVEPEKIVQVYLSGVYPDTMYSSS